MGLQFYYNELHHRRFPENFPNVCNQLLFVTSSFFFLSRFSFKDADDSQDNRGTEGTIYSSLPFPPAHEYSDIYLQLCM